MTTLALMAFLAASATADSSCESNAICRDIVKLKPKVDRTFALKLAKSIGYYSKKLGTNPKHSVAIAMQESSFKNINRAGVVLTPENAFVPGSTDLGVFQLHVNTIRFWMNHGNRFDIPTFKSDVDYQTYWHIRTLRLKIRQCSQPKLRAALKVAPGDEWSCYHSFTPKHRKTYMSFVKPYLAVIR